MASSYLSSWCSERPVTAGCAAGEDEAGRKVQEQRSGAREGCCSSKRSHSRKGTRRTRGSPADPDCPR